MNSRRLDERCVNALRMLAVDMVEGARSGHPGMPLGAAPMAYVLWTRFLRHNPRHPGWPDRDRFVLSAGHGSALLYALLHLTGYDLPMEELRRFRQWGSRTPGHPELGLSPGVEATTGPLGQGFGMAVGMALAEHLLAGRFNRPDFPIVDHHTYVLASDGDLMEGVASEAASLAGHLRLGKLIVLYDDNHITIDGPTELTFTEDVCRRFEAYGWHVQRVEDGNDLDALEASIAEARSETAHPSLIAVRTHIGYGSPKQDQPEVHGEPLGEEAARATRERLGLASSRPYAVPPEAAAFLVKARERGAALEAAWMEAFAAYTTAFPGEAERFQAAMAGKLPAGWKKHLPAFHPSDGPMATRVASGRVLNVLAPVLANLVGGSADLARSTKTWMDQAAGRNLHFGVREHAMGTILNGMALHGGWIPFGGTFLVFSDYLRPALRLAALMQTHVIYVFSHDSIGLGEDGPTHQPVEHLASLRAIPGLTVIRPADANETTAAWKAALERKGPTAIALTRQDVPVLDPQRHRPEEGVPRGAYILEEASTRPELIVIGTGSEVHLCLESRGILEQQGIPTRVVSMPSWELFAEQPVDYRQQVLPPEIRARIAVEAAAPMGWCRWVGDRGQVIGVERFGASAPGGNVMAHYGFTAQNVVQTALELLKRASK